MKRPCLAVPRRVLAVLALAWAGMASPVFAASLQVSPISIEIASQEQGQALYLSNTGTATVRAQVRVQQWSQADGQDQLAPTRDVVASPPLLEIQPGARQMVRIVRLQPAAAGPEKTYRLIVDELPPGQAEPAAAQSAGLRFNLRYSIPVFVQPAGATAPVEAGVPGMQPMSDLSGLTARLAGPGQSGPLLVLENRGPRRLKLSQLVYVSPQGQRTVLTPGLLGYVLAGQRMQWPLALPAGALQGGASLKAKFNDDQEEQVLPLALDRS